MGDLERAMAAALDPRKLSPASGGAALGPGGARSAGSPAPGSTAKWQVCACLGRTTRSTIRSPAQISGQIHDGGRRGHLELHRYLVKALLLNPVPGTGASAPHALTARPRAAQEALWVKLAAVLEQLHVAAVAVWHLQRVLAKKRDPLTHTLFLDVVRGDDPDAPLPCERTW